MMEIKFDLDVTVPPNTRSPYHWCEGYVHGLTGRPYKAYGGRGKADSYCLGYQEGEQKADQINRAL